ncbi:efflux RND transporter periplasmic adaptor subunit [Mucilaginibacter sp. L3T2-6]|uniref:efflux RND transporter periplasmic adaptor subunit n=1 Tax=Mucilaginibacter sp. L3T2-6 TaxID=3062491 RepID=UPI0026770C25|nr:efflux RND transporter periplasmic adaptor subunit [Mucilaginibacter sp. L3T2-6]MDO3640605.1 efflux RND transporter periplasmic adaptor subunit [Mucilaginibacter sp. L3T2-6]MDV6213056.1 efflux RND transporter periplasmic adaptor subunit [Mucilaginibacter sp. L3T2-6]
MNTQKYLTHPLKGFSFSKLLKPFIGVIAGSLIYSCGGKGAQQNGQGGPAAIAAYKTFTLQPVTATLNTDYPASLQGLQNIEIRPKVDGFVDGIYVDEGTIVHKGQLLFKIKAPQYEQEVRTAEAGVQTALADVNTAQLQVNKVKPLVEKDIISHFELESAQYALQTKQAALAQAKAALANAKVNLGYTTITSPVDGVIGSLPYKLGSLVNSTTADPLTTVYNTATIYAYFAMNEKQLLDFSRDSAGKSTSLKTKLNSMPKVSLLLADGILYDHTGKVETVNGLINTNTGSANFRAAFVNPRGLLRTGSSATVRIPTPVKDAIVVPQNVTYELQDKRFVYVVDNQNKVKNVAITTMDNTPGQYFIVTGGVKAGDKIIAESVNNLKDDTQIKPSDISPDVVYKDLK